MREDTFLGERTLWGEGVCETWEKFVSDYGGKKRKEKKNYKIQINCRRFGIGPHRAGEKKNNFLEQRRKGEGTEASNDQTLSLKPKLSGNKNYQGKTDIQPTIQGWGEANEESKKPHADSNLSK